MVIWLDLTTDKSRKDSFSMTLPSTSKMTSICGTPRGTDVIPSIWNFHHCALAFKHFDQTGCLSAKVANVRALFTRIVMTRTNMLATLRTVLWKQCCKCSTCQRLFGRLARGTLSPPTPVDGIQQYPPSLSTNVQLVGSPVSATSSATERGRAQNRGTHPGKERSC